MDERTSSKAELAYNDQAVSKTPSKIPIIIAVILGIGTIVLLITTIVFVEQKNEIAAELDELKVTASPQTPPQLCTSEQCFMSAYAYLSNMNKDQNPCDNFFEYACGGWTDRYSVPDDRTSFSTFTVLREDVTEKLNDLIERPPQANEPASFTLLRNFYTSCVDLDTINSRGAKPLEDMLNLLGGWPVLGANPGGNWIPTSFDFEKLWGDIRGTYDTDVIVATGVWPDPANKTKYKLEAYTPSFVIPSVENRKRLRDLYSLIDEPDSEDNGINLLLLEQYSKERQAYLQYMIDIAVALGANPTTATEDMMNVIDFETTMANLSALHSDSDYVENTLEELGQDVIDWERLYQFIMPTSVNPPVTKTEPIVNYRPNYIGNVTMWLKDQDDRVKANYMIWRIVNRMVPYLNETFLEIRQKYLNVVQGTSTASPRWKTCTNNVNSLLEFITGRLYVDEYFPEDAKQKTLDMIRNLQTAFKSMLQTNDWLQEEDKGVAAEKADAMKIAIGYPEWVKDNDQLDARYAALTATDDAYFSNSLAYRKWTSQETLALLRLPVEGDSMWSTGPAVVNAFYSPSRNGILFPAGILQPPFYHRDLPWYSNYGGIGAVIGHEITHGFDNNGRQYDKDGNFRVWWSDKSIDNFLVKAKCIIDQYSSYVMPENGRNLNGGQTQGENIADNGGLREAYKAYKDNISNDPKLPGVDLTDDQMFFLSWSQVWCSVFTPEGVDNYIDNQVHSPGRYRVIGPLQNNEAFNAAFNCPSASYMNAPTKCKVWY